MPRLRASLADVDSSRWRCQKPSCNTGSRHCHRHHVRNESMWFGVWATRRRGEEKFELFQARYHEFHTEDTIVLCEHHHAEIHQLYDDIIQLDRIRLLRRLEEYSWSQAERLMSKLATCCRRWLQVETPGIDSHAFTLNRKTNQLPKRRHA